MNFGWEYVWHCHILSHEEMDMMRPQSAAVPPIAPTNLAGTRTGVAPDQQDNLTWTDNSLNETGFIVRRALTPAGPWTDLATLAANVVTYSYAIGNTNQVYLYQVIAINNVGYAGPATQPGAYSTLTVTSVSNVAQVPPDLVQPPAAPTGLTAVIQAGPQVLLTWTDNASDETGFTIERAVNGGAFATLTTVGPLTGTGSVSTIDTAVTPGNTYDYRVAASNAAGLSAWSNTASVTLVAPPAAPAAVTVTTATSGIRNARFTLTWIDNANNETGYTIQRANNATFTAGLVTSTVGANVTTFTTGTVRRNPTTPYYFRVRAAQRRWSIRLGECYAIPHLHTVSFTAPAGGGIALAPVFLSNSKQISSWGASLYRPFP